MEKLSLRWLESKSWRANQRDGLFDLFFATLFLGLGMGALADWLGAPDGVPLAVGVAIQVAGVVFLWLARRWITAPRLGRVRFGASRRRRVRTTRLVLAACVAVTAGVVTLTALGGLSGRTVSRLTVSAIAALLVFVPLAAIAYFQEFPRMLLYAALFAAGEFGGTLLEGVAGLPAPRTIAFGGSALVSAAIGATILLRFLRLPPLDLGQEDGDGA
jgi:hypothetical protein